MAGKPANTSAIRVQPRVAPAPVSSGISFRQLPEATLLQIVKTCQHYEDKCSGSYSPASPSSRYLYDLSRDVQDLVRVLKPQEDGLGARVRELEHLLREWQGVFGTPDAALVRLGISAAAGTHSPQHVARRLLALDAELREERSRHAPSDSRHAHEVAELRAALRDTGRVSREQATYEVAALQAAARAAVEEERGARCRAEAALQEARAGAAAAIAAQVAEQVDAVRTRAAEDAAAQRAAFNAELGRLQAELLLARQRADVLDADVAAERRASRTALERHAQEVASLQTQLADARAAAAAEAHALRDQLETQGAEWARALDECNAAWRATDSVVRAVAQDERIAFLNRRLAELERLTEAMQGALLARQPDGVGPAAGAPQPQQPPQQRAWCGGALTAHTSGSPASQLAPTPTPATARHRGVVEEVARVKLAAASAAAGGRGVIETQYYAVVA